ncbi:MAG: DUF3013 family protein [Atopostipes suicloacalis]|nr:DUF3013 family protein [Atopostipes suicloacalis]
MIEEPKNYQWRLVSDSHKGAIELYLAIKVQINPNEFVQDFTGQVNAKGELYFEELVCFYDEKDNKVVQSNYLKAIPVDPARGIEMGYVDAFLKQLNIRISTAKSQIKKFLEDKEQKEFSLTWSEENMGNTVKTMRETGHYSSEELTFSRKEEKSLIDEFRGEDYDGLARV